MVPSPFVGNVMSEYCKERQIRARHIVIVSYRIEYVSYNIFLNLYVMKMLMIIQSNAPKCQVLRCSIYLHLCTWMYDLCIYIWLYLDIDLKWYWP